MNEKREKATLEHYLSKLDVSSNSITTRPWFDLLLWLFSGFLLVVLIRLNRHDLIGTTPTVIGSAIIGTLVGTIGKFQNREVTWQVLRPHINRESIEDRIEEIRT